ncbi:hypothetical protein F0L74_11655 [Chitinophaga agrisoli]|uniref:Uncharacterized protein n=1 Tax=Chitinophaga agrisoli TaxID=2607653 RepID=A0A5B2VTQ4_9BACT|nr:hypothetical protein [Chitinophaga agrisoli]KAA2243163.1 hypothetical protein F0L74_11655 [Chitinophaga agrisoli]
MGKQRGPIFYEGTIDGRTYYKRDGKYYVRKKSSLSARRVKRTPAFRRTMEYAGWMAAASIIGSAVYWKLPEKERKRKRYQALTGEAMRLLRDGVDEATVQARLEAAHVRKEVACNVHIAPVACDAHSTPVATAELPASIGGQQRSEEKPVLSAGQRLASNQRKSGTIVVIPPPAGISRRPRVLRYKGKSAHVVTLQRGKKASGNPPVAVPA